MMLTVGLTGGIASGKSTIARMFADRGCITVDADALVAELYQPGHPGHDALVKTYGQGILAPDGLIDRARLSAIAFKDRESIAQLNALIHPIVMAEEGRRARQYAAAHEGEDTIYMVEATLLIEAGGRDRYDRIVVVDIAPNAQIERGVGRGMAGDEVERRMRHQMSRDERLRWADYVIDNSGSSTETEIQVDQVLEALRRDLEARKEGAPLARRA